jgi:hypothetical protein
MGWDWALSFLQPTAHHSNQRKMLRRGIGPQRITSHDNLIESEAAKLATELEKFEGNPTLAIQRYSHLFWSYFKRSLIKFQSYKSYCDKSNVRANYLGRNGRGSSPLEQRSNGSCHTSFLRCLVGGLLSFL